jgi:hypothetical protein
MRAMVPFALALTILAAAPAAAGDAAGCRDLPVLQRLPGCTIRECRTRDYDEAELQSGPVDGTGDFPRTLVDGEVGTVTYACPASTSLAEIAHQAQASLRRAGYAFVYTGSMLYNDLPGFTARRGATWVQLVSEPFDALSGYTVTMVRASSAGGSRRRPGTRPASD